MRDNSRRYASANSFYDGVEGLDYPKEAEWLKDHETLVSATFMKSGRVSWSAALNGESCHGWFVGEFPDYFKLILKKVMNDS